MAPQTLEIECACHAVNIKVEGDPTFQAYCHCVDCRRWHQRSPLTFAVYPWDRLEVTKGSDQISKVSLVNPELERLFCTACGYRLHTQMFNAKVKIVPVVNLDGLSFKPQAHVFCKDALTEGLAQFKHDGLPKWAHAPPQQGGNDEQVQV